MRLIWGVWTAFAVLIGLFAVELTPLRNLFSRRFETTPGIPLILAGIVLVVLVLRARMNTILKSFLIAAGASAIGWPGSLFLHSFLYRYFPTEPVTYILFFFVFPGLFVIGSIGALATGFLLLYERKG
jgi:hypothetical protein